VPTPIEQQSGGAARSTFISTRLEPETMAELHDVLPVSGRLELIEVIDHFPASTPNGFLVASHVSKSLLERAPSFHPP
jgi:hypothetical protein